MKIDHVKTLSVRELNAMKFKKPDHLLAPWFIAGESVMVFSPPGVGKSLFAMSTAIAVAGAGSFLGWKAHEGRKVLLIDGEMPLSVLRDRTQMLAPGIIPSGVDQGWQDRLDIMPRMHPDGCSEFVNLCDQDWRDMLSEKAVREKYDLIILDNLSVLADVVDENSAGRMHSIVEFLLELKRAGVAIMLIHHAGKNERATTARGSSKLNTSFENIISLQHQGSGVPLGCEFKLTWTKRRNVARAEDAHPIAVKLIDGQWDHSIDADIELREMVKLVKSGKFKTQHAIGIAMGHEDRQWMTRMKKRAVKQHLITAFEWTVGLSTPTTDPGKPRVTPRRRKPNDNANSHLAPRAG